MLEYTKPLSMCRSILFSSKRGNFITVITYGMALYINDSIPTKH